MKCVFFYKTQIGLIGISENGKEITNLFFEHSNSPKDFIKKETPLISKAFAQINEYLNGKRKSFDLPLSPYGTDFQLSVWNSLLQIPYGETKSYKQIAVQIGNPKACRAVGMANRKNPIPIFIPCHRVIGSKGNLTGFSGGLDLKKHLLSLESKNL